MTTTFRYLLVAVVAVAGLALSLVLAAALDVGALYGVAVVFLGIALAARWAVVDDLVMAALTACAFVALAVLLMVRG